MICLFKFIIINNKIYYYILFYKQFYNINKIYRLDYKLEQTNDFFIYLI